MSSDQDRPESSGTEPSGTDPNNAQQNAPAEPAQPAELTQPAQPTQSAQPRRPQPEYGEYAPEGWVSPFATPDEGTPDAGASPAGAPVATPSGPSLAGVPHNLGVSGSSPAGSAPAARPQTTTPPQSTPPQQGTSQPQGPQTPGGAEGFTPTSKDFVPPETNLGVGTPPPAQPSQAPQYQPQAPVQPAPQHTAPGDASAQPRKRVGDRVATVILLVVGAYFALSLSLSMMSLDTSMFFIAQAAGLEDFRVPDSVGTVKTVGVFAMLALFAVMLIWSIQRMRAGKLAFWVPLGAGVISVILLFVTTIIAMMMAPELIGNVTPENFDQILRSLSEQSS